MKLKKGILQVEKRETELRRLRKCKQGHNCFRLWSREDSFSFSHGCEHTHAHTHTHTHTHACTHIHTHTHTGSGPLGTFKPYSLISYLVTVSIALSCPLKIPEKFCSWAVAWRSQDTSNVQSKLRVLERHWGVVAGGLRRGAMGRKWVLWSS